MMARTPTSIVPVSKRIAEAAIVTEATTLFDKLWADHVVVPETTDAPAVLYVDLHIIHEVTTPQAFTMLRERGLSVRRPDLTLATMDHSTPTTPVTSFKDLAIVGEAAANQIRRMEENCREFGIDLIGFGNEHRGIVHVIGPELGATQPGKTIVCDPRDHWKNWRRWRHRSRIGIPW